MSLDNFNGKLLLTSKIDIDIESEKSKSVENIKLKKYLLPNGNYYKGKLSEFGYLDGDGQYLYLDGSVYIGTYRRGLRQGQGKFIYSDSSYYEGDWKSNYRHGYGKYQYSNGDFYQGMWFLNKKHGIGNYYSNKSKCIFRGIWKLGDRNGPAILLWNNISYSLSTNFTANECLNENCTFVFDNKILISGRLESFNKSTWNPINMINFDDNNPIMPPDRYAEFNVEGKDENILRTVSEIDDLTDYITNYSIYKQIMMKITDYLIDETILEKEIQNIMDLLVDKAFEK